MKTSARLLITALAALFVSGAHAEGWICVGDQANGFAYQNGAWTPMKFKSDSAKYVIKRTTDQDRALSKILGGAASPIWVVNSIGTEMNTYCVESVAPGIITCSAMLSHFAFNPKNLTFVATDVLGYLAGPDNNGRADTTVVIIGRCSAI